MFKVNRITTFLALVICFLPYGSNAGVLDDPRQETVAQTFVPFHKRIECLSTADLEKSWLATSTELDLGMAAELDAYLSESFPSESNAWSNLVHVTLFNRTNEFRGFLRQSGSNDSLSCEIDVEITGEIVLGNETVRSTASAQTLKQFYLTHETRRTKIYAHIVESIAFDYERLVSGHRSWNWADRDRFNAPEEPRNLEQTCFSIVKSAYTFSPDEFMCAPNGPFFFGHRADGDLAIWKGLRKVWSAGSHGDRTIVSLQSDGNLIARDGNGTVLWDAKTNGAPDSGGEVQVTDSGEVFVVNTVAKTSLKIVPRLDQLKDCASKLEGITKLYPGDHICSENERYSFGLSLTGDLCLWFGPKKKWSAGTAGQGAYARFQADGNFVVRASNDEALWRSGTGGSGTEAALAGASVVLDNAGVAKILTRAGITLWAVNENTAGPPSPTTPPPSLMPAPVFECIDQETGGFILTEGQVICASRDRFKFGVINGDLALWDGGSAIWSAELGDLDEEGVFMKMQGDGNLVVRNGNLKSLWTSKTSGNKGASIILDEYGVAKILSPGGNILWAAIEANPGPSPSAPPPSPSPPPLSRPSPPPISRPSPSPTPPPSPSEPAVQCIIQETGVFILSKGQVICDSEERFKFGVIDDDLALWEGDAALWSAGLSHLNTEGIYMKMQRDGNLVVRNGNRKVLWASNTSGNNGASIFLDCSGVPKILSRGGAQLWAAIDSNVGPSPPVLPPALPTNPPTPMPAGPAVRPCLNPVAGQVVLSRGDFICSPNKKYRFGLTSDGDLALFDSSRKTWSANTCCTGQNVIATLQLDGNLVVSTANSQTVLWTSQSDNMDVDTVSLIVGDDGVVTITDPRKYGHLWSSAVTGLEIVGTNSLEGKVMAGYQGWFFAKGDGGLNRWSHWGVGHEIPGPGKITIDFWPDLRELDDDELYPTLFTNRDGSTTGLYSAYNTKTVERHTRWMKEYGLDGVFVQRFIGTAMAWTPIVDKVLANVRSGAEKYGRTFVTMYDIGNGDDENIVEDLINDWKHLVDDEHVTKSKQYLHHRGRPLVAIWGFGFHDRLGDPLQVAAIIDWFQNTAPEKYKATLMGGVPTGWRDLSRDSKKAQAWASIYRSYDVISPWTVGRMVDVRTANYHRQRYTESDLAECNSLGIDYLPVVFPGFSFNSLKPLKEFNEIPRNGGTFMWHQMHNAIASGSKMIYVAMFDEVDEATAIFKLAENKAQLPKEGQFLTTNYDPGYEGCPNDWYLNITGSVSRLLREGRDVPLDMPAYP